MAKNSIQDYAKALYQVTKDLKGNELKKAVESFAELLNRKNIIKKTGLIIAEFEKYAAKMNGEVTISVTTARSIDKTTLEQIKKIFGKQVTAEQSVDESLLGGVIVKTEDTILDASLRTQLKALRTHLV